MALPSDGAETLQLAPQLSLKSEPESERILAVGGIKQPKRHIPRIRDPPDLDTEEQEIRIRHQLETIRNKLRALLQICASGLSAQPHTRQTNCRRKRAGSPLARRSASVAKCSVAGHQVFRGQLTRLDHI